MKRIILLLLLPALLPACKKNDGSSSAKTILLSRSLVNGHNNNRYYYNAGNKLTRFEAYDENPPNGLISYAVIEYDASNHITQLTTYYSPGDIASGRSVITYNANNQIGTALVYDLQGATPNVASAKQTWNYNAKGQWTSLEVKDKNDKLIRRSNLLYGADGSLTQTEDYEPAGNQLYMTAKTIYSIPGKAYPPGLDELKILLGPNQTALLFNENIQYYSYSQAGVVTYNATRQMSGREYNANGTLAKQTITYKRIKPANTDIVDFAEYEYTEQ